jgi:hypothetical protein
MAFQPWVSSTPWIRDEYDASPYLAFRYTSTTSATTQLFKLSKMKISAHKDVAGVDSQTPTPTTTLPTIVIPGGAVDTLSGTGGWKVVGLRIDDSRRPKVTVRVTWEKRAATWVLS